MTKTAQQLGDGNNNNSQNNINNSIILVHSGLNSNLDILKDQFNLNMDFNKIASGARLTGRPEETEALSGDLHAEGRGGKQSQYEQKSTGNQPRSAQSLSGERLSSGEPNDVDNEEANNQMLMQILYNNLKKKQSKPKTRRHYTERSQKRAQEYAHIPK